MNLAYLSKVSDIEPNTDIFHWWKQNESAAVCKVLVAQPSSGNFRKNLFVTKTF